MAIVGLIAAMAVMRFGHDAIAVGAAEGYARRVALAMQLARRQAIAEGTPAAVVFARDAGGVTGFTVVRVDGADTPVEADFSVPTDVAVATPGGADRWEFAYTGVLTTPPAGGVIAVTPQAEGWTGWRYDVQVNAATGQTKVTRVAM